MSDTPLYESSAAAADANGIARVSVGPLRSFETWDVRSTTVTSTSSTLVPTCKLYRGAESPSRLIDGTFTGTLDTTDTPYSLRSGDKLVAVWTGCDVGAQCTVTLEGQSTR